MKPQPIQIRLARRSDSLALVRLFYDTVHRVNCQDYSQIQLEAWAPPTHDPLAWQPLFVSDWTFIAELVSKPEPKIAAEIVGFCELDLSGHIGCFYCHYRHQRQGVGSALLKTIEITALDHGLTHLGAEVSITAKPFFEHQGFHTVKPQQVEHNGVLFHNFLMRKPTLSRETEEPS